MGRLLAGTTGLQSAADSIATLRVCVRPDSEADAMVCYSIAGNINGTGVASSDSIIIIIMRAMSKKAWRPQIG